MLAVACSPLGEKSTLAIGVVARLGVIEGIVSTKVAVDGTDAAEKIIELVNGTRFKEQIRLITVNGIGFAGLNVLDINELEKRTETRLLSITRTRPHPNELINALKRLSRETRADVKHRIRLVQGLKRINMFKTDGFYAQTTMPKGEASKFVKNAYGVLRLAHMIASGVSKGESKGRM